LKSKTRLFSHQKVTSLLTLSKISLSITVPVNRVISGLSNISDQVASASASEELSAQAMQMKDFVGEMITVIRGGAGDVASET
jgi:hypothetical protein